MSLVPSQEVEQNKSQSVPAALERCWCSQLPFWEPLTIQNETPSQHKTTNSCNVTLLGPQGGVTRHFVPKGIKLNPVPRLEQSSRLVREQSHPCVFSSRQEPVPDLHQPPRGAEDRPGEKGLLSHHPYAEERGSFGCGGGNKQDLLVRSVLQKDLQVRGQGVETFHRTCPALTADSTSSL